MREDPVINMPIRGIQLMLKTIAFAEDSIPVVNPDGIFDSTTEQAVRSFQKEHGLPVTGVVDLGTFDAIVNAFTLAEELLSPAVAPVVNFPAQLTIAPGQSHPHIYMVQAMFSAIHMAYPEFTPLTLTGQLDEATETDLRLLQKHAGLKETGQLNKVTWNRLALLYQSLFDRNTLPTQG